MSRKYVAIGLTVSCWLAGCRDVDPTTGESQLRPVPPLIARPAAPIALTQAPGTEPAVDVTARPMARIPAGTVIADRPPAGWSNLVLLATPTLTEEDLRDAPKMATYYAQLFKFVLLADVSRAGGTARLDKVAIGLATQLKGHDTVITSKQTLGADLGLFGRRVLTENEAIFDRDLLQVVRADTFLVFDAQAVLRVGDEHVRRVIRHAFVVNPETGQLSTLVWLLAPAGADSYRTEEKQLQLLPPGLHEARLLSVKREHFTLGIPTPEAFALRRIPQGIAIPFTPELQAAAAVRQFTPEQARTLEAQLRAAVARVAQR